ncbi:DNA-binding transcriptional regulator, MerR family [Gracilibacillus orientalis]|uniref:DNA-binding transcriptional regulator, MerR family n=1 Tax=Gracilibacillus orientalis TaxID=334253 RepID=A0A1I4IJM5_9BACI|nr:MerR family transcriptional regulator [Gracilibacillus orientalis]SFL54011.1 DNA-binding transcriptional regulator, MerR family [Gracilibacillus orientalis]
MNDNNIKHFTTGEFAKLCKVNKQTLFYYDQIGLLSPVFKTEKGYRFYSIHQLELFNVIALLKDLGMSLNDIRQYVENKSPEGFLSIMYHQKEKIMKQRMEIEMKEKMIDAQIELMNNAANLDFDQVTVERLPEQTFYLSKNIENITDEVFFEVLSDFLDELYKLHIDTGHPIGGLTKREQMLKGEFTNYSYLYIKQPHPKEDNPHFTTVQGDFLIGYHVGEAKEIPHTYERLLLELDQLNLDIGEYALEEYIYDTVVKDNEEQYVTKIMIHVKHKQG